jgi:hypothetical protein
MVDSCDGDPPTGRVFAVADLWGMSSCLTAGVSTRMDVSQREMYVILESFSTHVIVLKKVNGVTPVELAYLPSFLNRTPQPTSLALTVPPRDLCPALPPIMQSPYQNPNAKCFWLGSCCPVCGRLNSRELFFGNWHCLNCSHLLLEVPQRVFTARELSDPDAGVWTGVPVLADWVNPSGEVTVRQKALRVEGGYIRCGIYEFGTVGRVIHLVPSITARGNCDEMFLSYQTQDIEFRRGRMMNHKGKSF